MRCICLLTYFNKRGVLIVTVASPKFVIQNVVALVIATELINNNKGSLAFAH